jgi:murein hydrolase activator
MARVKRLQALAICLLAGVWAPPEIHSASAERDLEGIKQKIQSEKRGLSRVQKEETSMVQSLGKVENELQIKNQELKQSSSRLNSVLSEMREKETELLRLQEALDRQKSLLAARAAALYRWHRGVSPLVILNGDMRLASMLKRKYYLQATVAFDRELVHKLTEQAARQEALTQALAQKKLEADDHRRTLATVKSAVEKEAQKKRQILASIRQEKESRTRVLKELEQAALRLQKMMEELARQAARKPQRAPSGAGLAAMRGKLDWPVKGLVIGGFGKAKHREFSSEVFRNGLEIEAPAGEEIRAVEKGKVVFADRFSGYGKMLIIDHGDRYYTVYAHLADFLKKNGDLVKRGEPVALVGDTDSLAGAKLYFEMRKDGRSIDPSPWFRR